ncbi:MAG: MBL fold metallo-hydrolase [Verrucomicrobiia bacterium]
MQLEDSLADVLGKAARGLGLTAQELAGRSGVDLSDEVLFSAGSMPPRILEALARTLGLRASSLSALATGNYIPPRIRPPAGFFMATTPFGAMTVNAYLLWDLATRQAALFDSGGDAEPLLEKIGAERLSVQSIFITHAHGDHIYEVGRLAEKTHARVWVPEGEGFDGGESFSHGRIFRVGGLRIESRRTAGHAIAGASYFVEGLELPLVIVGDALFSGSIGGAKIDYSMALEDIRSALFSLPPETIVCPGHGPMTTIGFEKEHNPFFPDEGVADC